VCGALLVGAEPGDGEPGDERRLQRQRGDREALTQADPPLLRRYQQISNALIYERIR
jgi:hypothetical protein